MIAQILSVNLQATKVANNGKSWSGYEVTYQPQATERYGAKPPTTRFVFKNSPIAGALESIKPQDWVEIKFDQTQYKNPESLVKIANPNGGGQAPPAPAPSSAPAPQSGGVDWDLKDRKIARAVAFKGATEIVSALIAVDGAFPKTALKKPEFFVEKSLELARQFEPFVNMEEGEITSEECSGDDADFDQEPF